jgi:hypothetical protein
MGPTEVLPVLHQKGIERDPVAGVHPLAERGLGLFGCPGSDHAEAVRDPVHVRVDRDRRDAVAEDEDAVRGLRSDAGDGGELVEGPRDRASEAFEDLPGAVPHDLRFHPIEPRRSDERLDLRRPRAGERGGVREPGEEPGARRVRVGVPGTLRKDRADEHLERVLGVVAQVGAAPVPCPVERAQPVEQPLPVERPGPRRPPHRGSARESAAVALEARVETPGSERSGSSSSEGSRRSSPMR